MPELPEVHTTATMLHEMIVGLSITDAWSGLNSPLPQFSNTAKSPAYFKSMRQKILGATITKVHRRAKNVLIDLDSGHTLLIHMKMTGHLMVGSYTYSPKDKTWIPNEEGPLQDPFNRFMRIAFSLSNNKTLVLCDARKFAKVRLLETQEDHEKEFGALGPEPLEATFNAQTLRNALLRTPKAPIKSALMNQELVSGIGNIYSDEILWIAGIHPESIVSALPQEKFKIIYTAAQRVLSEGIGFGGDSTSDYRNPLGEPGQFHYRHRAYRRTKLPCTKRGCSGTIVRTVVRGRSAHFCDFHQILYRTPMRP